MAQISGSIPVTGFIAPTDTTDTYPVTDAIYGIDGFRSVSGSTSRDSITLERRREGMLVYTQDDGNVWQLRPEPWALDSTDWKIFISSGISSILTATTLSVYWTGGTGTDSIVSVNQGHLASGINSFVGGGTSNSATTQYSSVVGGQSNLASGYNSFVGGGQSNVASGIYSVVVGSEGSVASGIRSSVVGSKYSTAGGNQSFIGGGENNNSAGICSFIGGGILNSATTTYSSVVGGKENLASGTYSFIGGGQSNVASGIYSVVVGGLSNLASGIGSAIVGGNSLINPYDDTVMMQNSIVTNNLSADTIHITTTTVAPFNFSVLPTSFTSSTNGDAWISADNITGTTLFNVVVSGVTKSVELS